MLYKSNRGIALTWEAYVSYKDSVIAKGTNQQQLMFPHHFYLLQHFTSHVKVSEPGDLLNYDELDEEQKTMSIVEEIRFTLHLFAMVVSGKISLNSRMVICIGWVQLKQQKKKTRNWAKPK